MTVHPEFEQLSALADGELSEHEQVAVQAHLALCTDCFGALAALRSTLADLDAVDEPVMDEQAAWAIRSAVRRERKLSGPARRYAFAAGTAAAAIVGILVFVISQGGSMGDRSRSASSGGGRTFALTETDRNYDEKALTQSLDGIVTRQDEVTVEAGELQGPSAASGGGTSAAPASTIPQDAMTFKDSPGASKTSRSSEESARQCLATLTATSPVGVLDVIAARYKSEPVFLFYFEAPQRKPTRVELWVVTRSGCEVRYFRQQKLPAE